MKFLCIGNAACDIILRPRSMERVQERVLLESVDMYAGGDALDVAVNLSIMGESSKLVGCIGNDDFGQTVLKCLQEHQVGSEYLIRSSQVPTVTSILFLKPDGERDAAYRAGGNEILQESDVPDQAIAWADHVHLGSPLRLNAMDGEGTKRLFQRAKAMGKTTSMDLVVPLDDIWLPKIEGALHYCDIFLPSDYEVSKVCGLTDPIEMKEFFRPYGLSVFGVKMGAKGAYITDYAEDVWIPPAKLGEVKDTLGAGDAFVAAFLAAYKGGKPLKGCAALASIASGYVVQKTGTTSGMVAMKELEQKAAQFERELTHSWRF